MCSKLSQPFLSKPSLYLTWLVQLYVHSWNTSFHVLTCWFYCVYKNYLPNWYIFQCLILFHCFQCILSFSIACCSVLSISCLSLNLRLKYFFIFIMIFLYGSWKILSNKCNNCWNNCYTWIAALGLLENFNWIKSWLWCRLFTKRFNWKFNFLSSSFFFFFFFRNLLWYIRCHLIFYTGEQILLWPKHENKLNASSTRIRIIV